jgi:hypothetical protein
MMSSISIPVPLIQAAAERLPATPPIAGPVWTYLVPALLLAVASAGTWLLYRRFSSEEGDSGGS